MLKTALISCLTLCLAACSTVEITKFTDATYKDGLRFYRPEPYLLVTEATVDSERKTADSEQSKPRPSPTPGTITKQMSVIYLPNIKQEYVIRSSFGLGAAEVAATLEGGWNLTQLGTKVDTKVPETITALTGLLPGAGGGPALRTSLPLEPGLYRIKFDCHTGTVCGVEKITLPEKCSKEPKP